MILIAQAETQNAAGNSLPALSIAFVPFMIGTISLILYLSARNVYLAGQIRAICEKLCKENGPLLSGRKCHLMKQLILFAGRYKKSNTALLFAIVSVGLFGLMIASTVIPVWFISSCDIPLLIKIFAASFCVAGGSAASYATYLCLDETRIARRSLFSHIVWSSIESGLAQVCKCHKEHIDTIEGISWGSIDSTLLANLREYSRSIPQFGNETAPDRV